jgi:hypothetical protein
MTFAITCYFYLTPPSGGDKLSPIEGCDELGFAL